MRQSFAVLTNVRARCLLAACLPSYITGRARTFGAPAAKHKPVTSVRLGSSKWRNKQKDAPARHHACPLFFMNCPIAPQPPLRHASFLEVVAPAVERACIIGSKALADLASGSRSSACGAGSTNTSLSSSDAVGVGVGQTSVSSSSSHAVEAVATTYHLLGRYGVASSCWLVVVEVNVPHKRRKQPFFLNPHESVLSERSMKNPPFNMRVLFCPPPAVLDLYDTSHEVLPGCHRLLTHMATASTTSTAPTSAGSGSGGAPVAARVSHAAISQLEGLQARK